MTEPQFEAAPESLETAGGNRRTLLIGGGFGALALAALGGYLLLSGGGGSDSLAVPIPHHVVTATTAGAAATPSPSASAQSVLQDYHGDVDSRDPFAIPAAVIAASAPKTSAAPAAAPTASASPGTVTIPTTVSGPSGTTVSVLPGSGTTPTTVTVVPQADEFLQLLAAHHVAGGWTVDVRSASGIAKGVTPGTKNVDGTLFFYDGEDETSGTPSFVFELGESKGGNLVPNNRETAKHVHADKSTLVLHDGDVDGGIYAD